MNDTPRQKAPVSADAPALKRGQSAQVQRDLRSKAALKANMARRKAQVRARDDQDAGAQTAVAQDHGSSGEHQ